MTQPQHTPGREPIDFPIVISNNWLNGMSHSIYLAEQNKYNQRVPTIMAKLEGEKIFIERIRKHAQETPNEVGKRINVALAEFENVPTSDIPGLMEAHRKEVEGLRAALKKLTDGLQEIADAEGSCCMRCEGNGRLWADGQAHYPSYDGPTVNCGKCGGEGKIYPDLQGMIQDLLNAAAEWRGGNG